MGELRILMLNSRRTGWLGSDIGAALKSRLFDPLKAGYDASKFHISHRSRKPWNDPAFRGFIPRCNISWIIRTSCTRRPSIFAWPQSPHSSVFAEQFQVDFVVARHLYS